MSNSKNTPAPSSWLGRSLLVDLVFLLTTTLALIGVAWAFPTPAWGPVEEFAMPISPLIAFVAVLPIIWWGTYTPGPPDEGKSFKSA
jgi:hypothetical protein